MITRDFPILHICKNLYKTNQFRASLFFLLKYNQKSPQQRCLQYIINRFYIEPVSAFTDLQFFIHNEIHTT